MHRPTLLLVDGDARSLGVLEMALRKAGFGVTAVMSGSEALATISSGIPDLIISDTQLADGDGYSFCKDVKMNEEWQDLPFIFLTSETAIEEKIKGLELGVDEYLTKPIYIKEILTRVRMMLQRKEQSKLAPKKNSNTTFQGALSDLGVVDLFQTIGVSRKSGVIRLSHAAGKEGAVFFRDGKVIDADCGKLVGEEAVYRLLTWQNGEFEVVFQNVRRKTRIETTNHGLLMEGMRQLDEWDRLAEQLPSLDANCAVDILALHQQLATLPDKFNGILKNVSGQTSLMDVIDDSPYSGLETLDCLAKLYFDGILVEVASVKKAPHQESGLLAAHWLVDSKALGTVNPVPASELFAGATTSPTESRASTPIANLEAKAKTALLDDELEQPTNPEPIADGDQPTDPITERPKLRTKSSDGEARATATGELISNVVLRTSSPAHPDATPLPQKVDQPETRRSAEASDVADIIVAAPKKSWRVPVIMGLVGVAALFFAFRANDSSATYSKKSKPAVGSSTAALMQPSSSAASELEITDEEADASSTGSTSVSKTALKSSSVKKSKSNSKSNKSSKPDSKRMVRRAKRLKDQGRYGEALLEVEKALAVSRRRSTELLRVELLSELGQKDRALRDVDKLLKRNPSYATAWARKGTLLWRSGKRASAKQAYQKYLELEPTGNRAEQIRALTGIP